MTLRELRQNAPAALLGFALGWLALVVLFGGVGS